MAARAVAWRAGILAIGLLLAWRIIVVNAVLHDDNGRPRLPADAADAASLGAILRANPAEVAALLVLAQQHERAGDLERAAGAYEAALAIAPVDRDVLRYSAAYSLRHGRVAEAAAQLDRIATQFGEYERTFPVFMQLAAARDPGWARIVERDPAWLGAFILAACRQPLDPALLSPLLQRRVASGRAQAAEVGCVTEKLRAAGQWDAAYLTWINTLPRERLADLGNVYNGGFERPASGVGFDWRVAQGSDRQLGHALDFLPTAGVRGKRALRVTYSGKRQSAPAIEQFLALQPGRYELGGLARMDSLNSVRGLHWVVRCVDAGGARRAIGSSERFLGSSEWRSFASEVVVPPGCPGQVLQLEPVGLDEGATYLAGTAWFDDLQLVRRR
jgi:hypothetical protein